MPLDLSLWISIPRKNVTDPRSLIWNTLLRYSLICCVEGICDSVQGSDVPVFGLWVLGSQECGRYDDVCVGGRGSSGCK